jgi:glycosyltransferase involved in cell wall biosynthesis
MKLSVIIPCLNAAGTIATQLEALVNQHWSEPWEVIVADNGSTDGSLAIIERYKERLPNLRLTDASARLGQPYALNVGVQASHGESVAFCDADDEVGPGWVAAMGEALSQCDFVASRFETQKLNQSWVQETRKFGQRHGLQKIWYPPYLPFAGGCGLGVKRAIHDLVGGFDESLPYLHDTDYCFKIQLAGVKLHFVPDAIIHIRLRDKFSAMFRQARLWAQYNVIVYKRYQPVSGMTFPDPWTRYGSEWKRWLRRLPKVRSRASLGACVWTLGWQIGRLQGSIKCRVHPV